MVFVVVSHTALPKANGFMCVCAVHLYLYLNIYLNVWIAELFPLLLCRLLLFLFFLLLLLDSPVSGYVRSWDPSNPDC